MPPSLDLEGWRALRSQDRRRPTVYSGGGWNGSRARSAPNTRVCSWHHHQDEEAFQARAFLRRDLHQGGHLGTLHTPEGTQGPTLLTGLGNTGELKTKRTPPGGL